MIENNLDDLKISILDAFNCIKYTYWNDNDEIIKFSNGWFQIHFYIKSRTYYSEDRSNIVRILIKYCMEHFDDLVKECENHDRRHR